MRSLGFQYGFVMQQKLVELVLRRFFCVGVTATADRRGPVLHKLVRLHITYVSVSKRAARRFAFSDIVCTDPTLHKSREYYQLLFFLFLFLSSLLAVQKCITLLCYK